MTTRHYGKAQAIARLRRLIGKQFAYRENTAVPIGDERLKHLAEYQRATHQLIGLKSALEGRQREVLAADAIYQALKAERAQVEAELQQLHRPHQRRISVGSTSDVGTYFRERASGDTWSEVVAAVEQTTNGNVGADGAQ